MYSRRLLSFCDFKVGPNVLVHEVHISIVSHLIRVRHSSDGVTDEELQGHSVVVSSQGRVVISTDSLFTIVNT